MGIGGNMKYQYGIQRNPPSGWWLVFEGTEEDGFEVVASFLRRDDAELWLLEKEEDKRRA
jgi:hypothetical protein